MEQGAGSREQGAGSGERGSVETGKGIFRFQKMEIWKRAIDIGEMLLDIADGLEHRKFYRFAEQLRGAALSISNNIAEGSGSTSKKEFIQFLNIARRSAFENANMLIVFHKRRLIEEEQMTTLLNDLEQECRMLSGFMRSLKTT